MSGDHRIERAMRLLERLMGEDIDYERIAAAIGLSPSRFHHRFFEVAGETPGAYLRRIRLDAAATRLRWTEESVLTIATNLGYASQSSFIKAFERRHGMTPSRFRRAREQWPNGSRQKAASTSVRQRNSSGFRLLGRRYTGLPCYVPDYWQDFMTRLPEELGAAGRHLFVGLLRDDMRFVPPDQVRYDCCVTVSDTFDDAMAAAAGPGFFSLALPPASYASLDYHGYYLAASSPSGTQHIGDTYFWLLDTWLAQSRHRLGGDYVAEIHASPPMPGQAASCTILLPVLAA
jgi:AraC family transcriptional regulator